VLDSAVDVGQLFEGRHIPCLIKILVGKRDWKGAGTEI